MYNKKTLKNRSVVTTTNPRVHITNIKKTAVVDTQISTSHTSIVDDYTNIWNTQIAPNIYDTVPNIFTTTLHDNMIDMGDLYEDPQNCANPYCKNFMKTSFMMCDHSGLFF